MKKTIQRSFSVTPATAIRYDQLLDQLGFVFERTSRRTRYAPQAFITALTEGEVRIEGKKAVLTIELP